MSENDNIYFWSLILTRPEGFEVRKGGVNHPVESSSKRYHCTTRTSQEGRDANYWISTAQGVAQLYLSRV